MKAKISTSLIIIFFLFLFFLFYKGLENSNIYTPNLTTKKNIPLFKAKLFYKDSLISSDEIFKKFKEIIL